MALPNDTIPEGPNLVVRLFLKGSNYTRVDLLANDHFKVLNMTFIHVILVRCYGPNLFTHTVI